MARTIEPFQDPRMPERFLRWIESAVRARFKSIPCYTESAGDPEAVITGQPGDTYLDTDNNQVYVKTGAGTAGWTPVLIVTLATTAELTDITDAINTDGRKREGFPVFDSVANQPLWARAGTPGAVWVDGTGAVVITPV